MGTSPLRPFSMVERLRKDMAERRRERHRESEGWMDERMEW